MKSLAYKVLVIMLVPAMAMAAESSKPQTLVVPGTMTPSGQEFASQCSDEAFAKAVSAKWLADKCEHFLKRWRWEATYGCYLPSSLPESASLRESTSLPHCEEWPDRLAPR